MQIRRGQTVELCFANVLTPLARLGVPAFVSSRQSCDVDLTRPNCGTRFPECTRARGAIGFLASVPSCRPMDSDSTRPNGGTPLRKRTHAPWCHRVDCAMQIRRGQMGELGFPNDLTPGAPRVSRPLCPCLTDGFRSDTAKWWNLVS